MKKYLLSIAALLLGLLAHSQEADDLGNYAEVSIIPRLDLNPVFGTESVFTLGNTSLYTLFEGSASEHFSWTLANHWVSWSLPASFGEETGALYTGLGFSDTNNLIDMMYADLTFGNWSFRLGKDCIATGGYEYEDNDWLVHPQLASPLWNDLPCYQWGGKVTYTTPSEMSSFSLQMLTSPFGERPFGSGLWSFSGQWSGEYGWYSPLWSVSAIGAAPGQYAWLVSLGNRFHFGDWTVTLDWTNTAGMNEAFDDFLKGSTIHGRVSYTLADRWDLSLRGNYIFMPQDSLQANWWTLGTVAEFFPLRDSQDLRLHAFVDYNSQFRAVELCVGAVYSLTFKLW